MLRILPWDCLVEPVTKSEVFELWDGHVLQTATDTHPGMQTVNRGCLDSGDITTKLKSVTFVATDHGN